MLRCGIVSTAVPGITSQQSFNAEPPPFHYAVSSQGITGILGTGWSKSARRRTKRTDQVLIAVYQPDQDSAHLFSTRLNSIFNSPTCAPQSCRQARLTMTTRSNPHNLMLCCRNASLMILFARFRSAAPASILLPTTNPSLAFFLPLHTKKTLKCLSATLSARTTWSKPSLRNNRCVASNFADKLDCESCTALRATCIDNSAAPARFHPHQKTVRAFSSSY